MLRLTPLEVKKIQRISKGRSSISAKEYRDALANGSGEIKSKRRVGHSFTLDLTVISSSEYIFTLSGRHLSTNSVNSLGRGDSIRYKNSIKNAFIEFFYINRFKRPKVKFNYAIMTPTFYNPRTRDDDSDSATMKIVRDSIVNAGFLVDDDRKHLKQNKYHEVISKEWKIEVHLIEM